ncbi:lipid A deacylase LpxR family protein [Luteimonas fraxinea]|uniref:Lipid A deacylase LpxR family protein n=1 Tax=Luteimonas fraxinea TaxID=2901869 RepID=A0ABS8U6I2_9GAMM|nr:lipid A deacylase LpxR family protein [Luteimonas fraxinea]MCD9095385.1 lipid A deacylase LpxR family protein [Luteimonas fraxinea]MCD9126375.1 lipid A deacylase LpxR family protein [Luteimonas fraxinea]UHH11869.1 lipid A deacylase LpxR family protein [Luteimonas fraxinea]
MMPLLASAQDAVDCRTEATQRIGAPVVNLRIDNDTFGGRDQDQGYSNGLQVTLVSPNLVDYTDDPCLPSIARRLNRYMDALYADAFEQQNMVVTLGHAIYTPTDPVPVALIEDDRPYAGALLVGLGYNARHGDRLRTSLLRVGVVGPAALGGKVQSEWHRIVDADRFRGWDNQLRNEPVFQYIHERMRRWPGSASRDRGVWDAIGHAGFSVGNFATYANTGIEFRLGLRLPDDFGSTPVRPAGENTAPRIVFDNRWNGHLFVTSDARWVLRDITLDGNTFRDSHSVDKRAFVADVGYGVAVTRGRWKLAFARYHRTREFERQRERPVYGSFTIGRQF